MRRLTFKQKIFLYSTLTIVVLGVLLAFLGTYLVSKRVLSEAQTRISLDLQAADFVYMNHIEKIFVTLSLIADKERVIGVVQGREDLSRVQVFLEQKKTDLELDFLTLCDASGRVLLRTRPPHLAGDNCLSYPLIQKALQGEGAAGTVILLQEMLQGEGEGLASQGYVRFVPTPRAKSRPEEEESSGMCIMAAVPVLDPNDGRVRGVLYGGNLLNRNYALVDYIRDMIFEEREYKGREFGTVTIFQWDVRISTNVLREDGTRAIGTRVSEEVYHRVLEEKERWLERAFVVHDWYISAYEPILGPDGDVIGILYVGVLEDKYTDIRNEILLNLLLPLTVGVVVVLTFSYLLARDLSGPLREFLLGTEKVASGDLDYRIRGKVKYPEIEQLTHHFNSMTQALKEREDELRKVNEDLRRVNRNYMEMLGFISHQMKNALGNMIMSAYNLRDGIVGKLTHKQKIMAGFFVRNSERLQDMIKNYMDLSRIERGELKSRKQIVDFEAHILSPLLGEIEGQLKSKGMRITTNIPDPYEIKADPDLLRIIMENLLTNAIKYGKDQREITIRATESDEYWQMSVWNEGEGIPEDQFKNLFSRFTRLNTEKSKRERGSGLGLFITKEMVEKQGGHIWVESKVGQSVRFSFVLPKDKGQK